MTELSPEAQLEALLFTSGEPLSLSRLAKILGLSSQETSAVVDRLKENLRAAQRGLVVVMNKGEVMLATRAEAAPLVEELTKSVLRENLSKAALETLSIIAYRSPATRSEIDAIRGVNSSFTLRNLLLRGLIERTDNPEDSRGYIYRPTVRLLQALGLSSLEELPDYQALSGHESVSRLAAAEDAPLEKNQLLSDDMNI
jgi:segregation and condensation protein B